MFSSATEDRADPREAGVGPQLVPEEVGQLHRPLKVAALGEDPEVGLAVVVELRPAGGEFGLGGVGVMARGVIDPPPDLVGIFEVHLQVRFETGVRDPVDGVAVADQPGQLRDVVVGRGPGNGDPHVGVGLVGEGDHVLPRRPQPLARAPDLLRVRRETTLPTSQAVRHCGRTGPYRSWRRRVQVAKGSDRLQGVQEVVGEDLGRPGGVTGCRSWTWETPAPVELSVFWVFVNWSWKKG